MFPNELKVILASVIAFLVTEGLKVVGKWLHADLSGAGAVIAASLTTAFVVFAESLLVLVPDEYKDSVTAFFGLLVALLGAFGVHAQIKRLSR